jgi:hypothetical protein
MQLHGVNLYVGPALCSAHLCDINILQRTACYIGSCHVILACTLWLRWLGSKVPPVSLLRSQGSPLCVPAQRSEYMSYGTSNNEVGAH